MVRVKMTAVEDALKYFQDKMAFTTGPVELKSMLDHGEPVNVVDVRQAHDYATEHIPGSINLPKEKWGTREGLSKDKTNVLVCYSEVCHLAATAAVEFARQGYPVMEMDGGMKAWKENKLAVEA